jgi:hypothetical protein
MNKVCQLCGKTLEADWKFCPFCGPLLPADISIHDSAIKEFRKNDAYNVINVSAGDISKAARKPELEYEERVLSIIQAGGNLNIVRTELEVLRKRLELTLGEAQNIENICNNFSTSTQIQSTKNVEDSNDLSKIYTTKIGLQSDINKSNLPERVELDNIFRSTNYSPAKLIEFFKRGFRKEYAADAGLWERYTIERHTLMVLHQFEKYFSRNRLPGNFKMDTFRVILALHDIGVPAAIEEGTRRGLERKEAKKAGQVVYTTKLMASTMDNLGFSKNEIAVGIALVSDDPIGSYLKSDILQSTAIQRMARESGMQVLDFFDLLEILYMVDAGSYTEDAGGIKSLDYLFIFDKRRITMTFSPEISNKISKLRKSLEW